MNAFELALRDIASIRGSAKTSVQLQAMQVGLLTQMSATMGSIHNEMAKARKQQADALAIQQELLAREQMQAYLEEFIYQTQKLITECSKADSDVPSSTRFFLLRGVLMHTIKEGIATPIIKGRDNKAAFDLVINEAKILCNQLQKEPQVQQAIAWAKQMEEKRRLEEEAERIEEAERQRKRRIEQEREDEQRRLEQAKQSRRMFWIIFSVIGGSFFVMAASVVGCCILGQLATPRPPRPVNPQPNFPGK